MKKLILLLLFFGSLFNLNAQEYEYIKILLPQDYKEAISGNDVQLVDVRTAAEFNEGHIQNAINIDYSKEYLFTEAFEKLDIGSPVYLYCRSGNRSQKAAAKLIEMGFEEIYDLRGGYVVWKLSGYGKY